MLVDFVDEELIASERRRVELHLAVCETCRAEVRCLRRSLAAARAVWGEAAEEAVEALSCQMGKADSRLVPRDVRKPRSRKILIAALGTVSVVAAVFATWIVVNRWSGDGTTIGIGPVPMASSGKEGRGQADGAIAIAADDDMETIVNREAQAARLAAAARLLASEPSLKAEREQAERYLAEAYGRTTETPSPNL
jgi:hypothetical protein